MVSITPVTVLLGCVILQRLIEVMLARRNADRLIEAGARDVSGDFYLIWMALQGGGLFATASMADPERSLSIGCASMFALLVLGRIAIILRDRRQWVTRFLVSTDGTLIQPDPKPYRWAIYAFFIIESAALPLLLGLPVVALLIGFLHVALTAYRLRLETSFVEG